MPPKQVEQKHADEGDDVGKALLEDAGDGCGKKERHAWMRVSEVRGDTRAGGGGGGGGGTGGFGGGTYVLG